MMIFMTGELALTTKKHDHLSYYGFMWDVRAVRRSIAVCDPTPSPSPTPIQPYAIQHIPLPSSIFSLLCFCAFGCKSALDAYQMLHTGGRSRGSR
jgi:hypothetical protein